jgi:DNA polymerase eta
VRDLSGDIIYGAAMKLWKELHGTDVTRAAGNTNMKIINISIAFTGLDVMESGQQGIEGFFKSGSEMTPTSSSRKRTREAFEATNLHEVAAKQQVETGEQECPTQSEEIDSSSTRTLTWECPRCRSCVPIMVRPNEVENERIDTIRLEHEDWHFAKDLAREKVVVLGRGGSSKATTRGPPVAKKKRKEARVDIASYFKKN